MVRTVFFLFDALVSFYWLNNMDILVIFGCLSITILIFNCAFLVGFGCHLLLELSAYSVFLSNGYVNCSTGFLVIGILLSFTLFGLMYFALGEAEGSGHYLALLKCLLIIVELAIGVAMLAYEENAKFVVETLMKDNLKSYGNKENFTEAWDAVQKKFNCCGAYSFTDWQNASWSASSNVPDSCCLKEAKGCGQTVLNMTYDDAHKHVNIAGCYEAMAYDVETNIGAAGAVSVGLAAVICPVMVIGLVVILASKK